MEDLIQSDLRVRRLFASLTAEFIRTTQYFQGSNRAFERNYSRTVRQLNDTVKQLAKWQFDERRQEFRPYVAVGLDHIRRADGSRYQMSGGLGASVQQGRYRARHLGGSLLRERMLTY